MKIIDGKSFGLDFNKEQDRKKGYKLLRRIDLLKEGKVFEEEQTQEGDIN